MVDIAVPITQFDQLITCFQPDMLDMIKIMQLLSSANNIQFNVNHEGVTPSFHISGIMALRLFGSPPPDLLELLTYHFGVNQQFSTCRHQPSLLVQIFQCPRYRTMKSVSTYWQTMANLNRSKCPSYKATGTG